MNEGEKMRNFGGKARRGLGYGVVLWCCLQGAAVANPLAPTVVSGAVGIATSGATMTITQDSQSALIDWESFAIGAGETVNIIQPSASSTIVLRVTGSDPVQISGALHANGQVSLVNPAGISFGESGLVDAATLALSEQGVVVNQGQLTMSGWQGSGGSAAGSIISSWNGDYSIGSIDAGIITSYPSGGYLGGTITSAGNDNVFTTTQSLTVDLHPGWNLIGHSSGAALDVATELGAAGTIKSVWKWVPASGKWAYYAPGMGATELATYTADHGYDVLTSIDGGEGFWVHAEAAGSVNLPVEAGIAVLPTLVSGWNLVAPGFENSPGEFNLTQKWITEVTQAVSESVPQDFTSLWAWDSAKMNWYFYSPSLEAQGGTALADYISANGLLDFQTAGKVLSPWMGVWVQMP
jgi:filamentous hemagglutinin family protein